MTGNCVFPRGGYGVTLEEGNVGIVPEPGLLALQLKIAEPEAGPEVVSTVPVTWEGRYEGIQTVRIQGGDDLPRYIDVELIY